MERSNTLMIFSHGIRKSFLGAVFFLLVPALFFGGCLSAKLQELKIQRDLDPEVSIWQSVVEKTLDQNPDLRESRYQVESAARGRDIALAGYLPSAEGDLARTRSRSETAGPAQDRFTIGLGVEQPLFTGFRITGDFLQAKRNLEAEEYAYLNTSAEVRRRLRLVYVDLLRLQRLLETNRQIEERRAQNAELIHLRYEAGREHLGSSLRAQAIADQAAFETRQTERAIETQSMRMGRETGGDFVIPFLAGGEMETLLRAPLEHEPDFSKLAESTPEVQEALKSAEGFKAGILSAQGELWPQAAGVFSYGGTGENPSALRDEALLGLRVSLPLFEGGANVQGIRRARSDYGASLESARSLRDEKAVQQAEAWAALKNAYESVRVRRKFLEAAIERSDIIRSQYTTGLVNYQDFDLAEQDLADSQKAYVEALANALTREAEWDFAQGLTLEEWIIENRRA